MNFEQFLACDGVRRVDRVVRQDPIVEAALAVTSTPVEDIVGQVLLYFSERFDSIAAKCPHNRDPVFHIVEKARYLARAAARSSEYGYHTHEVVNPENGKTIKKPCYPVHESDFRGRDDCWDKLLGPTPPQQVADGLWADSTAELERFRRDLFVNRPDQSDRWLRVAEDGSKKIGHKARKDLSRAFGGWKLTGKIPGGSKHRIEPPPEPTPQMKRMFAIKNPERIVGTIQDFVVWDSEELLFRPRLHLKKVATNTPAAMLNGTEPIYYRWDVVFSFERPTVGPGVLEVLSFPVMFSPKQFLR